MRAVQCYLLAVAAFCADSFGQAGDVELTKVDRSIRKEPAYREKPRYGLLVVGPTAETRIWLVIDGRTLYVDRNGNGDLTEEGESVAPEKESKDYLHFAAGEFVEADGKTKHSNLHVYQYTARQYSRVVNGVIVMDVRGALAQGTSGENGHSFATMPKDAPIAWIDGPMTMRIHSAVVGGPLVGPKRDIRSYGRVVDSPLVLREGETLTDLHVQVGTVGLGEGTFAAVSVEKDFPEGVHPGVRMVFPRADNPKASIVVETALKDRC